VVVELGGGDVFIEEDEQLKEQLVPKRRDKISMRQTTRYFIFTLFIADFIVAHWQNEGKNNNPLSSVRRGGHRG